MVNQNAVSENVLFLFGSVRTKLATESGLEAAFKINMSFPVSFSFIRPTTFGADETCNRKLGTVICYENGNELEV